MIPSTIEIMPGVRLDSRKALFLEEHRLLCVADLHLGYEWAHRQAGQLLPIRRDDSPERIRELCEAFRPKRLAILGDIIHRDVPHAAQRAELCGLARQISECSNVEWIAGNHDRQAAKVLGIASVPRSMRAGRYVLTHGDAAMELREGDCVIMGHEHPAIRLGDGVRGARFPCFLCGPEVIVLPAFSHWAAGTEISTGTFMSPIARASSITSAVAIMGDKLLKVPLG